MSYEEMKQQVAKAALPYLDYGVVIGVGSGSTVNVFIKALACIKGKVEAAIASSKATATALRACGINVIDLNTVGNIDVYIDSTDEINEHFQMLKGRGGALTGEKIVASCAKQFICLADCRKQVELLGCRSAVVLEVLPQARSAVGRAIVKLGGNPVYRENVVTDHGNVILDVTQLDLTQPLELEMTLNNIPGVVENGIFAKRSADILLLADQTTVKTLVKN